MLKRLKLLIVCFCWLAGLTYEVNLLQAQNPVRGRIILPPAPPKIDIVAPRQDAAKGFSQNERNANALSTVINAYANRTAVLGGFLEARARARRTDVETDSMAMDNSVKWIETYFERRRVNKQYRDDLTRDYQEKRLSIARHKHRQVTGGTRVADPTSAINFMLQALISNKTSYTNIFLPGKPTMKSDDLLLSPSDVRAIQLTAGGGNKYSLAKPVLVDSQWPKVFDRREFSVVRVEYDAARGEAVNEIDNGSLSLKTFEKLNRQIRELSRTFDEVYQWKIMQAELGDIAVFCHYRKTGEHFLQVQTAGALRAFASKDPGGFQAKLDFDGDMLTDVLKYCSLHNVALASPDPSGIEVYNRMYQSLRNIYLEFIVLPPDF